MSDVEIYDHAVDNFIKRVEENKKETYSMMERFAIRRVIRHVVYNPLIVKIDEDEKMAPIHISGDIAVIVGVRCEDDGKYIPYESLNDELVAPTVYHSSTYINNENDGKAKQAS